MPLTHFPYGVSGEGGPVAGAADLPFGPDSARWYVDVVNGNDGNGGEDVSSPLKTVEAGYAKLRSGYYDTLFLVGLGTAFPLAAQINWTKTFTNLVGLTAPVGVAQRARITTGASTNLMTPMITFGGRGTTVRNIHFYQAGNHATSAAVCVLVNGERHYFENCHFAGGAAAAAGANAAMRSLQVDGGGAGYGENLFRHCTIGLDTVLRASAASAELELSAGTPRNVFESCLFIKNGTGNTLFVKIGASGIDRWVLFKDCLFHNYAGGGGGSLTNATSFDAASGGNIMLVRSLFVGVSAIPANALVFADPEAASNVILKGLSPT